MLPQHLYRKCVVVTSDDSEAQLSARLPEDTHKVTEVRVLAGLSQVYSGDAADLWLRLFL